MARVIGEPNEHVIVRYVVKQDYHGNPRRAFAVKRTTGDYLDTVAFVLASYEDFDALADVLDYKRLGPVAPYQEGARYDDGMCHERRHAWVRRVIDIPATATEIKRMAKAQREQEAWEEKEIAAGRSVR